MNRTRVSLSCLAATLVLATATASAANSARWIQANGSGVC